MAQGVLCAVHLWRVCSVTVLSETQDHALLVTAVGVAEVVLESNRLVRVPGSNTSVEAILKTTSDYFSWKASSNTPAPADWQGLASAAGMGEAGWAWGAGWGDGGGNAAAGARCLCSAWSDAPVTHEHGRACQSTWARRAPALGTCEAPAHARLHASPPQCLGHVRADASCGLAGLVVPARPPAGLTLMSAVPIKVVDKVVGTLTVGFGGDTADDEMDYVM